VVMSSQQTQNQENAQNVLTMQTPQFEHVL
jgi:hypothetical protein